MSELISHTLRDRWTDEPGTLPAHALRWLADRIEAGHADGSIRAGDPATQARAIFLTSQAFVISHRPATADQPAEALLTEFGVIIDRALEP